MGTTFPEITRPVLAAPQYTPGCLEDPTRDFDKNTAHKAFQEWLNQVSERDIVIYSDGFEIEENGIRYVGFGYAIYQGTQAIHTGKGSISSVAHVFDAEAIGALKGLQRAAFCHTLGTQRIWLCIDSTSVIRGINGTIPTSSQWAFLEIRKLN